MYACLLGNELTCFVSLEQRGVPILWDCYDCTCVL